MNELEKQYETWYKESRKKKSNEEIEFFNNEVLCEFPHDYESICHAIAASTLTHLHNCLYRYGATGTQASYITWQIIRQMFNIETGAKLINFDKMLYPQYELDFIEQIIPKSVFEKLQEKAKESLESGKKLHPSVREHMESLAHGDLPFGYGLGDED